VPFDVDAEAAQVVQVGGEGDQGLVDVGTAHAGVATQRRLEDPDGGGGGGSHEASFAEPTESDVSMTLDRKSTAYMDVCQCDG